MNMENNFFGKKENKKNETEWDTYIDESKDKKPRVYVMEGAKFTEHKNIALDIGAGGMRDTRHLLNAGFETVIALDANEKMKNIALEINDERLETVIASFEEFNFPENTYDLINAQYSLPFIDKKYFNQTLKKIKNSLKVGGVFCGTFFGEKHSENTKFSNKNFHNKEQVENMFSGFEILSDIAGGKEKDGPGMGKPMIHWHTYHVTAKKLS